MGKAIVSRKSLILAFAFLLPILAIWWLFAPSYLDFYVPLPSYHGDIWHHTSRSTFSYTGRSGVEYVVRRDGTAYTEVVGWQTANDGLSYFDRWLAERGFERTEMYLEGDPVLPESRFLKFGQTFAVYTRPDDRSGFNGSVRGAEGRVTVAVWPVSDWSDLSVCQVKSFNVVVVTAKPSLLKAFADALDD
jgi:hypothetical protein